MTRYVVILDADDYAAFAQYAAAGGFHVHAAMEDPAGAGVVDKTAANRERQRRYRARSRNAQPLRDRNAEALRGAVESAGDYDPRNAAPLGGRRYEGGAVIPENSDNNSAVGNAVTRNAALRETRYAEAAPLDDLEVERGKRGIAGIRAAHPDMPPAPRRP
jgi:hypothetical protein